MNKNPNPIPDPTSDEERKELSPEMVQVVEAMKSTYAEINGMAQEEALKDGTSGVEMLEIGAVVIIPDPNEKDGFAFSLLKRRSCLIKEGDNSNMAEREDDFILKDFQLRLQRKLLGAYIKPLSVLQIPVGFSLADIEQEVFVDGGVNIQVHKSMPFCLKMSLLRRNNF